MFQLQRQKIMGKSVPAQPGKAVTGKAPNSPIDLI